ncbi:hypothetical protein [Mycobacterium sp. URHB0021]
MSLTAWWVSDELRREMAGGNGSSELCYADPDRRALAAVDWDIRLGDRQGSVTVLVCRAEPGDIADVLHGALLTDTEWLRPAGDVAKTHEGEET